MFINDLVACQVAKKLLIIIKNQVIINDIEIIK